MISDLCGRAKIAVGSVIPEQVFLGYIRTKVDQSMGCKPVSNIPLYQFLSPGSCVELLPWFPSVMERDWGAVRIPSLPQVAFGHGIFHSKGKSMRTLPKVLSLVLKCVRLKDSPTRFPSVLVIGSL